VQYADSLLHGDGTAPAGIMAAGPALQYLPASLWLLGLGHLG
jgi:hypothetical protein